MFSCLEFFLFTILSSLPFIQNNQNFYRYQPQSIRKHRHISLHDDKPVNSSLESSNRIEPFLLFQNEPLPLASSVVDDLTTLASTIYVISLIIIIFILLAWVTHYNAPCSSIITTILSTITGLPESIIHSVALCGSCCVWCEKTWLFRRIHQFNIWLSYQIKQFISGTCKVLYDTICPCCRPPDTPSNRSLIGSLPANIIARIQIPDITHLSLPEASVTTKEPSSQLPQSPSVDVDSFAPVSVESFTRNHDSKSSKAITVQTKTNTNQIYENELKHEKRRRQPRKKNQLKQRSMVHESAYIEQQINENSDDDVEEEENLE